MSAMEEIASTAVAHSWLTKHNFFPNDDLRKPIVSTRASWLRSTAMYEACWAGELAVCRWLHLNGAGGTIRTNDNYSYLRTPMFAACWNGHLHVAQWLVSVGAAEDVRTTDNERRTPLHAACLGGHLKLCRWLFSNGAAEDVRSADRNGLTPLHAACCGGHLPVVQWLIQSAGARDDIVLESKSGTPLRIASNCSRFPMVLWLLLKGAATDPTRGHIDAGVLSDQIAHRDAHREHITELLKHQAAVLRLLFVATRSADHFSPSENLSALSSPTAMDALAAASLWPPEIESLALPAPTPSAATLPLSFQQDNHDIKAASVSPWALLRGHEATILPLIGEFSGLLCGRALRHARECEIFL